MKKLSKGIADVISDLYTMYKDDKGLQQVMNTTSASGGTTKQQQGIAGQALSGMLGNTGNIILGLAQSLVDGTLTSFVTSLPTFIQAGIDLILNLIDGVF